MFSHIFARKRQTPMIQCHSAEQLLPRFRKVVVPAAGAPYAQRALRTACRLARMQAGAEVHLVYLIEVPRAFALAASLPGEEALADDVLSAGQRTVEGYGCAAISEIQRGRDLSGTLLKYLAQQDADLLVLGARPDGIRGLPLDLAREMYDHATVPVILDYIAGDIPRAHETATTG